jgi:hypothetical protein
MTGPGDSCIAARDFPRLVRTNPAAGRAGDTEEIDMGVRIRSLLATGPLLVPLNSGGTVRLSPGGLSGELPEVEVADNPRVTDLLAGRAIEIVDTDQENG